MGGHRTMVSAVAMFTHGLGGDSHVRHDARAAGRVAADRSAPGAAPQPAGDATSRRSCTTTLRAPAGARPRLSELDGMIVVLDDRERALAHLHWRRARRRDASMRGRRRRRRHAGRLDDDPASRRTAGAPTGADTRRRSRPTDASHVLGPAAHVDARRRDARARSCSPASATASAGRSRPTAPSHRPATIDTLVRRSAEAVLAAAFAQDGLPDDTVASRRSCRRRSTGEHRRPRIAVVDRAVGLSAPLIALGASAAAYYPRGGRAARRRGRRARTMPTSPTRSVRWSVGCASRTSARSAHRSTVSSSCTPAPIPTCSCSSIRPIAPRHRPRSHQRLHDEMIAAGAPCSRPTTSSTEQIVEVGGTPMFVEGVADDDRFGPARSGHTLTEPGQRTNFQGLVKCRRERAETLACSADADARRRVPLRGSSRPASRHPLSPFQRSPAA